MNRLSNGPCTGSNVTMDMHKDWQLELLMEKLRAKASQMKTFSESSKSIRMTLLDKRYALDSVEKTLHQKCLDTLQHSIKVTSLQSMVERLESLTRQLGLKFVQAPSGVELFISSDMFYLEIVLNQTGAVCDVKVHHEGSLEQKSCEELVSCLSKNDFADFTAQLEGFASIYQLNAEKKIKAKAFTALQSLEADLSMLAQLQTFIKEPFNVLHKSPVGVLEKRRGGHAMRLTYFVSPYDLIDTDLEDIEPISVDTILERRLGYSVTVYMEGSTAHKLQTSTLISVRSHNGKNTPSYAPLTSQNSALIPACFVLKLNRPMPMCVALLRQIQAITDLEIADCSSTHPLLSLIAKHTSDGKLDSSNNRGLFVTLPDQTHCYFMTESRSMQGVLVSNIPFTHPAHVAQILVFLRQQALFNTLIASCIRPNSNQDLENMVVLEVSALGWTHISIALEHPLEESLSMAEIDLSDISNLTCKIYSPGSLPPMNATDIASELTSKVLNRSFSIPITMRSILVYWEKQIVRQQNHFNGLENFNLPLGAGDPGGRNGNSGNTLGEREITPEPSGHGMPLMSHPHQGMFLNESLMSGASFAGFQSDGATVTPVLTNVELTNILAGGDKPKRVKRKATEDAWKSSAKRKPGAADDELLDASSCDSTSRSTPLSQDAEIATPNSVLGFHSDLELSALDASELIGDKEADFDTDDLGYVEELLSGKKDKSPLLPDFETNKLVSPSVSITPIHMAGASSGSSTPITTSSDQRRSGIEIFPISAASAQLSGAVTITPIAQKSDKDRKDKSGKRSDDKARLEKKKKRKREGSPMGPPEKIPSKADMLPKPPGASGGSGGGKPPESPPNSPNMARKFSQSPTHNRSLSGKLSPNLMKSTIKTHSPKHSPAHVPSSPKHVLPGISSPKSSPKHPSTSGSGKPSMSTLKNAASSPSSKSDVKKSGSKDSAREKDKKTGGSSYVNATKSGSKSALKVKPLDLNTHAIDMAGSSVGGGSESGTTSPGLGTDLVKSSGGLNQMRNRKSGQLSAIVDKLAKAQNCDIAADPTSKPKERATTPGKGENPGMPPKSGSASKLGQDTKNSEYVLLKHSSDCMKLTINKTRAREPGAKPMKTCGSSSSSNSSGLTSAGMSGTGSPKNHTGLKPGVNSGPASKKPQQPGSTKPLSSNPNAGYPSSSIKPFKSSSTSSSSSSASSSGIKPMNSSGSLPNSSNPKKILNFYPPKSSSSDPARMKERPKISKSSSEKSIFGKADKGKASPTQDTENLSLNFPSKKQFDKSFQIPKLSARTGDDKKPKPVENNVLGVNKDKLLDIFASSGVTSAPSMASKDLLGGKYQHSLPTTKLFDTTMEAKIRSSMNSVSIPNSLSISASNTIPSTKHQDQPLATTEEEKKPKDDALGKSFPISASGAPSSKQFASASTEPLGLAGRSIDLTSKFVAPAPKLDEKKVENKSKEKDELDFAMAASISSPGTAGGSEKKLPLPFPPSPSVSVHIVKSPAPSPHIAPSPHSATSPGITDDELMDEALIGLGK